MVGVGRFLRLVAILLISVACVQDAGAQHSRFSAALTPRSGSQSDIFRLQLIFEGDTGGARPTLLSTTDWDIRYISPQRSIAIVNGTVSQRTIFNFQATPTRSGELTIPEASITVGGSVFRTPPIRVAVTQPDPAVTEGLALSQRLSRPNAYVGEQVVLTTEITSDATIINPQLSDLVLPDIWSEDIGKPTQFHRTTPRGPVEVIAVKKALFPLTTGTIAIPSRTFAAQIRYRRTPSRRSPFGDLDPFGGPLFDDLFGGIELRPVNLRTEAATLLVQPLPPPPPHSSAVVVGQTSIITNADRLASVTGDALTLTYEVRSTANLNSLLELPVTIPTEIKRYVDRASSERSEENGLLETRKRFPFTLVPLAPGTFTIPPVRLTVFDPIAEQYHEVASPPITVIISGPPLLATPVPTSEASPVTDPKNGVPTPQQTSPAFTVQGSDGTLDYLREVASPELILFTVGALLVLLPLLGASLRRIARCRRRQTTTAAIRQAESAADILHLAAQLVGISGSSSSPERIRLELGRRGDLHPVLRLQLELLFDELVEACRDHSPLTSERRDALKQTLVEALPSLTRPARGRAPVQD